MSILFFCLAESVRCYTPNGHILDLILSPIGLDSTFSVKISEFVSDHAVVRCSINFAPQPNAVTYKRYHQINMSEFQLDLCETPFVKSPADSVCALYDQYVHDISQILYKHAPLVSRRSCKKPADWLSETYRRAKYLQRQFERSW